MPLKGIYADDKRHYGEAFTFDEYLDLLKNNQTRSEFPVEMIVAMSRNSHERRNAGISATMLTSNCPRRVILQEEEDYYEFPSDYWARFRGSIGHLMFEAYAEEDPDVFREIRFRKPIDVDGHIFEVSGKPDKTNRRTKLIVDYKSVKSVSAEPIKSGHPKETHAEQVSIYRWLLWGGECVEGSAEFTAGEQVQIEIKYGGIFYFDMKGVKKVSVTPYMLSLDETEEYIRTRLRPFARYRATGELPGLLRDDKGRRSKLCDYCSVRAICDRR